MDEAGKEGCFKVSHSLVEAIIFSEERAAIDLAQRLCLFLIKNTDRLDAAVEILKFSTEEDNAGKVQSIWWHHKIVRANLEIEGDD